MTFCHTMYFYEIKNVLSCYIPIFPMNESNSLFLDSMLINVQQLVLWDHCMHTHTYYKFTYYKFTYIKNVWWGRQAFSTCPMPVLHAGTLNWNPGSSGSDPACGCCMPLGAADGWLRLGSLPYMCMTCTESGAPVSACPKALALQVSEG